jgi:hypothetical protein
MLCDGAVCDGLEKGCNKIRHRIERWCDRRHGMHFRSCIVAKKNRHDVVRFYRIMINKNCWFPGYLELSNYRTFIFDLSNLAAVIYYWTFWWGIATFSSRVCRLLPSQVLLESSGITSILRPLVARVDYYHPCFALLTPISSTEKEKEKIIIMK